MKKYTLGLVILTAITVFNSCKKAEDDETTTTKYVTSAPPATDYLYGNYYNSAGVSTTYTANWTIDGKTFEEFTNQFKYITAVNVCDGFLVVHHSYYGAKDFAISYADLDDLSKFTKISSERMVTEVAILNGVVMATAQDGNNFYFGYCEAGNSEMTFNLLPASTYFSGLNVVGNKMVANGYSSTSTSLLVYSLNGKDLVFTSTPLTNNAAYKYFEGNTWAFSYDQWAYISGDDLSLIWTTDQLNGIEGNTTDTNGSFYVSGSIIPVGKGEWRLYGSIHSTATGINYPCVNISPDQGQNWTTHFLTGIPSYTNNTSWSANIYATSSNTIIDNHLGDGTFEAGIYSSTDGKVFTKWTDQTEIENFGQNFQSIRTVNWFQ